MTEPAPEDRQRRANTARHGPQHHDVDDDRGGPVSQQRDEAAIARAIAKAIAAGTLDVDGLENLPTGAEAIDMPLEPTRPGELTGSEAVISLREEETW